MKVFKSVYKKCFYLVGGFFAVIFLMKPLVIFSYRDYKSSGAEDRVSSFKKLYMSLTSLSQHDETYDNYVEQYIKNLMDKKIDLTIPKVIHYIWLGGPMYENYWINITKMAAIAQSSGYTVSVWVDDPNNLRYLKIEPKRLPFKDNESLPIKIHNDNYDHYVNKSKIINVRLISALEQEYKSIHFLSHSLLKQFWKLVRDEMHGLRNYGAASDMLRYLILFICGGIYLDTDTIPVFSLNKIPNIGNIKLKSGFKNNVHNHLSLNSIIICLKNHPILGDAVQSSINNTLELGKRLKDKRFFEIKRKTKNEFDKNWYNRRQLTIMTTGPSTLRKAKDAFIDRFLAIGNQQTYRIMKYDSNLFHHEYNQENNSYVYMIGDSLKIIDKYDNTWLKGKNPRFVEQ